MLIQAANAANHVREAERFHVNATLDGIDHAAVVDEMDDLLGGIAEDMEARYRDKENLTLFKERTEFVDERTVRLGGEAVTAEKVVVAAGSRAPSSHRSTVSKTWTTSRAKTPCTSERRPRVS